MFYKNCLIILITFIIASCSGGNEMQPQADKIPYEFEIHGKKIVDNYHWLRDKNWPNVSNPKILDYLNEENQYTDKFFEPYESFKENLFNELKGRIKLEDISVHTKKKNYFYYTRTESDKNYPIYCRKKDNLDNQEQIILDVNNIARDKKFTKISAMSVSPSQKLLAYSVDFEGSEQYKIFIKNLESGDLIQDEISSTIGPVLWHEDETGFFYTPVNANWRHDKVMFHKLGDDPKNDKLIMHETDILNQLSISKSSSKKYFFISSSGHDSNELYYFSMDDDSFTPKKIVSRKDKLFYTIDHAGQYFYIHTNDNGPNFRLLRLNIDNISEDKFEEFIPYSKDSYLTDFSLTNSYIVLNYQKNALPEIHIQSIEDNKKNILSFPDEAYVATGYSTNFEEDDIRINYSSLKRPDLIYSYNFADNNLTILKQQVIPSGFNPDEYEVKRIWAPNGDVKVPVTVFYKKSLFKANGENPLFLYGYGSYGYAVSPNFRNSAVSFADRGFVYAIAHIRGGDDLGFDWYESAKFLNKKNTFEDFIKSALYLIESKYTKSGNITILGGSAGGLLIGYSINNRPDLFKAAVAHVPFVDVVNTMLDETLPLTPGEFKEWGNPKEEKFFEYMMSYSPYDNVAEINYPNLYITAGLSDPRVTYWEAAKWVAKLRDKNIGNNKILLKTNMDAGHGGASGRFDYLKEVAEELLFIFVNYGIKE
jgi:oligopeptidase B